MGLAGAFALMQAQTALTASFSAREAARNLPARLRHAGRHDRLVGIRHQPRLHLGLGNGEKPEHRGLLHHRPHKPIFRRHLLLRRLLPGRNALLSLLPCWPNPRSSACGRRSAAYGPTTGSSPSTPNGSRQTRPTCCLTPSCGRRKTATKVPPMAGVRV